MTAGNIQLTMLVIDGSTVVRTHTVEYKYGNIGRPSVSLQFNKGEKVQVKISYSSANIETEIFSYSNIMFCKGNNKEYETYNENIFCCYGESSQYQNDGKNILPLPDLDETLYRGITYSVKDGKMKMQGTSEGSTIKITNGYGFSSYNSFSTSDIFLQPGTYTISYQNKSGTVQSYYPSMSGWSTSRTKMFGLDWSNTSNKNTFTITEPLSYIYISIYEGCIIDCEFNIQLENGSNMRDYVPYDVNTPTPSLDFESPITSNYPKGLYKSNLGYNFRLYDDLRGMNGYYDYIEVNTLTGEKRLIRSINIRKPVLPNYGFNKLSDNGTFGRWEAPIIDKKNFNLVYSQKGNLLCPILPNVRYTSFTDLTYNAIAERTGSSTNVAIWLQGVLTVNDFIEFIANNDFYFYYILENPTITIL